MNRNLLVVAVLCLVFVGCTPEGNQNNIIDPFIGGNVGLNLYLQNGAPPPMIYDGGKTPFGVNVVIENNGESDIGPNTENPFVIARIEGILPSSFGITDADLKQVLQESVLGAKKNFDGTIQGGQVANFVFPTLSYQSKLLGNQQFTIRSTLCYDYSNTATTQLCIKKDIIENVQDSTLCSLTGEKPVANSGGPIHITQVIQNPLGPNKIQVTFMVEHVGVGEFYGRTPFEDCNPSVRNANKFNLEVHVSTQNPNAKVTCYRLNNGAAGNFTMYNGAPQTVSCTIEETASAARIYTDVMTIRSFYRYGQFIEQAMVVQSVPG